MIDLGARVLDFATLVPSSSTAWASSSGRMGQFSRRYLTKIVQVAQRLARSNEEAQMPQRPSSRASSTPSLAASSSTTARGRISVCNENLRGPCSIVRSRDRHGPESRRASYSNKALLEFLERPLRGRVRGSLGSSRPRSRRATLRDGGGHGRHLQRRGGQDSAAEAKARYREPQARLRRQVRHGGYRGRERGSIHRARRIAARLAATDLTILINGESGTGKELFASAIHAGQLAAELGPSSPSTVGSLSDDLIESELFGYEEGAFTGARKGGKSGPLRAGRRRHYLPRRDRPRLRRRCRIASFASSRKRKSSEWGGSEIKRIDVRVIAASNEDLLDSALGSGAFREDLYFRLKTGTPPHPAASASGGRTFPSSSIPSLKLRVRRPRRASIPSFCPRSSGITPGQGTCASLRNLDHLHARRKGGSQHRALRPSRRGLFRGLFPLRRRQQAMPASRRAREFPPDSRQVDSFLLRVFGPTGGGGTRARAGHSLAELSASVAAA